MSIEYRRTAAIVLVRERGADRIDHPGGTLLAHLVRVASLLAEWDADADVQLAGLCHAAYGTDGFDVALLELNERALLAEAIGADAEALVYLYASCDREQTYPQLTQPVVTIADRFNGTKRTPQRSTLRAFVAITAANELDVVRHNEDLARRYGVALTRLFTDAEQHLSGPARQAWRDHQTTATGSRVPSPN